MIVQSCKNMMVTFFGLSTERSKCTLNIALSIVHFDECTFKSDKAFPVEHDVLLASCITSNKIGMVLLVQEKWRFETCCETVVFCNGRILQLSFMQKFYEKLCAYPCMRKSWSLFSIVDHKQVSMGLSISMIS